MLEAGEKTYATSRLRIRVYAKRRGQSSEKHFVLDLAQKMLTMGSGKELMTIPDNLAMLGSIALEGGRPKEAVEYFEALVNLRRRSGAHSRAMGEALCELAFARLFTGQLSRAIGESREGVQLMQTPSANGEYVVDVFLVRAMFKSAAIHIRGGQLRGGLGLYQDALSHGQAKHLDDQYGQWKPSALARRVAGGVWRRFKDRFRG